MAKKEKEDSPDKKATNPEISTEDIVKDMVKKIAGATILDKSSVYQQGFCSTMSLPLNRIISGSYLTGGIPYGRITQIIGPHSSAKTVIATHILQGVQKQDGIAVLIDSENAYSPDFAAQLGLDLKRLIIMPGETLEKCFSNMIRAIKQVRDTGTTKPMVIVYDSIAASPSEKELAEALNFTERKAEMGLRARICSQELRTINGIISKYNVAIVIINQIRSKVGLVFGSSETGAGGGLSLDYYCSVIVDTRKRKALVDERKLPKGVLLDMKTTKNKVIAPGLHIEDINLIFDAGVDPTSGLAAMLEQDGLAVKSGSYFISTHPETGEEVKWQPKTIAKFLIQHPWILGKHKRWNEKKSEVELYWPTTQQVEDFIELNRLPIDLVVSGQVSEDEEENTTTETGD